MKKRAPLPKAFVHDGFTLKTPRIQNVRSNSIGHQALNSKVERLNGTKRGRETVMRGLDNEDAAQELLDAMRIHKATSSVERTNTRRSSRNQFEFRRKQGGGFNAISLT